MSSGVAETTLSPAEKKRSSCCGTVLSHLCSSLCFAVVSGIFIIQMTILNFVLVDRVSHWVWLSLLVEVPVALHMFFNFQTESAVQSGSLQWIVYCWLLSTKTCVLYFQVMPKLNYEEMRMLVSSMCLTPMLYMMLTTRTLRQLFDQSETWEGRTSSKRERREHVTLDVVLLQDMVWHVVIDMIDMLNVMFLARPGDPQDGIGQSLVKEFPIMITNISRAAGVFVCLGILFHQQSFPHTSYVAASVAPRSREASRSGTDLSSHDVDLRRIQSDDTHTSEGSNLSPKKTLSDMSNVVSGLLLPITIGRFDNGQGMTEVLGGRWGAGTVRRGQEYGIDVVKARKRSAIVSILLIDLPFFVLRTYLYSLSLSLDAPTSQIDTDPMMATASPVPNAVDLSTSGNSTLTTELEKTYQLDKWWVKNGLCLLLQAVQLRFVQQADLEQSQYLRWRDAHQFQVTAYKRIGRRRRMQQDPSLRQAWQELQFQDLNREPLEPAIADTELGSSAEESASDECADTTVDGATLHAAASPVVLPAATNSAANPLELQAQRAPSRRSDHLVHLWQRLSRKALSTQAQRQEPRYRRLFSCCCSCRRCRSCPHAIVLHSLMGLVAGWLIAKQDFAQAQTSLLLAMGKDASSVDGSGGR